MKLTEKVMAQAICQFEQMSFKQKELLGDEIFVQQPVLLGMVLVQSKMGNSMAHVDVALRVLLVLYLAVKCANHKVAKISEQQFEQELTRMVGHIKFTEGLNSRSVTQAIEQYISSHPEPVAFAFAIKEFTDAGIAYSTVDATKHLMMAGLTIVNCFAGSRKPSKGTSKF